MPYLAHFGLREHPFTLTPNTQQYFPTSGNTQVLQSLEYGIRRNSGIMKVVGDVGTGKTLLCRLLLRRLEDGTEVAYLNAPQADGNALIAMVCHEFGVDVATTASRADMLQALNTFLLRRHEEDCDCVLVVDEAQALGVEGLETIRLLSNLETEKAKLLQIVLFGQTELDDLLARTDLRQLNQRIAFAFGTGPLSPAEAVSYVGHRLRQARQDGIEWRIIEPKALDMVVRASGGVPRVINILCDKALLIAYGDGEREVTRTHLRAAIKDSPTLVHATEDRGNRRIAVAAAVAGLLIGAGVMAAASLGMPGMRALFGDTPIQATTPVSPAARSQTPVPVETPTAEAVQAEAQAEAPPPPADPTATPLAAQAPAAPAAAQAPAAAPAPAPAAPAEADTAAVPETLPGDPAPEAVVETPPPEAAGDTPPPEAVVDTAEAAPPPPRATVEIRSVSVRTAPAPELAHPQAKPVATTTVRLPDAPAKPVKVPAGRADVAATDDAGSADTGTRRTDTADAANAANRPSPAPPLPTVTPGQPTNAPTARPQEPPQARRAETGGWVWE